MKKILREAAGILSELLTGFFPLRVIPFSHIVLEQFFRHRMRKNDFTAVARYCEALAGKGSRDDRIKKTASDYFCKISLDNRPDPSVLEKLKTSYQQKISLSTGPAEDCGSGRAAELFKEALDDAGIPGGAVTALTGAFSLINGSTAGDIRENTEPAAPLKKIILSGMYWSGTGALYDFFKEFSGVKALPGEQRLWKESDYSLNWGLKNIEKIDDYSFRQYLLRLFLIPMTGLAAPRSWQDVLASNVGINFIRNDKSGKFSDAVFKYLSKINSLREKGALDYSSFLNNSVIFTDQVFNSLAQDSPGACSVLPDNAVHLADIEPFKFFSNAHFLCVFRDPRSNYAARYYENERFDRNPDNFIRYYRETRENYINKLPELKKYSDKIIEVQFEDFILSEDYRKSLAQKLGLDLSGWSRHKYFKPHRSEKNVYNYRNFFDQKAIDLIAGSLKEYCRD